jgi:hypothetical protein
MRLDHISYVTSHDQLADTVQRLGSRLGSTFVDGGVHPRFGTRNFTLPLLNGHYLEVVCPLDHPATDSSPFGKAVSLRANEGGGWLTWVVSVDNIDQVETKLGRKAVDGHRTKPDGTDLKWKQIGVLDTIEDSRLPFFIQWLSSVHPSKDGKPVAELLSIKIAGSKNGLNEWLLSSIATIFEDVNLIWVDPKDNDGITGVISVMLKTPIGNVELD